MSAGSVPGSNESRAVLVLLDAAKMCRDRAQLWRPTIPGHFKSRDLLAKECDKIAHELEVAAWKEGEREPDHCHYRGEGFSVLGCPWKKDDPIHTLNDRVRELGNPLGLIHAWTPKPASVKAPAPAAPVEPAPIPMLLTCPSCGGRHIDEGEFATKIHHTHECQHCGMCWRPAKVPTVGVLFLYGPPPADDGAEKLTLKLVFGFGDGGGI